MKIICNKDILLKNVKFVEGITGNKPFDILSNILIRPESDKLTLSVTDLETSIVSLMEAECEEAEAFTVSAKKLSDVLKTFPETYLIIEKYKTNQIQIKSTDSDIKTTHKLRILSAEDYPKVSRFDKSVMSFTIESKILQSAIRKTILAASRDENRYHLNCVAFQQEEEKDKLNLVATDGRRLAKTHVEADTGLLGYTMVPYRTLNQLLKILSKLPNTENVSVSINPQKIYFKLDEDIEVASNILEGNFPDYKKVIPESFNCLAKLLKADFKRALESVAGILDKDTVQIRLKLQKDKLTITGKHPEFGESYDEIRIEYNGDDKELGFNVFYLLDALKEIQEDEILIHTPNNELPVMITGLLEQDYINIVMPMKIKELEAA